MKLKLKVLKRKMFNPIHRSAGSVHDNITGRGMLKSLKHRPGHTCIDPRDFAKLNATCFAIQPARRTFFVYSLHDPRRPAMSEVDAHFCYDFIIRKHANDQSVVRKLSLFIILNIVRGARHQAVNFYHYRMSTEFT